MSTNAANASSTTTYRDNGVTRSGQLGDGPIRIVTSLYGVYPCQAFRRTAREVCKGTKRACCAQRSGMRERLQRSRTMIRLITIASLAFAVATSAQALTPAPMPQPEGMGTLIAAACGAGRTRVNGVCVARTTVRQTRRAVRRCATGMTC
jgi:hypothetical protein